MRGRKMKRMKAMPQAVERLEEYSLRRTFGAISIVWAALFAVAGFITLKVEPIILTWLVAMAIGVIVMLYLSISAGLTLAQMKPLPPTMPSRKEIFGEAAVAVAAFALLFVAGYFGGYMRYPIALLLPFGAMITLTYFGTGKRYPERLVVAAVSIAASPPIYTLGVGDVAYAAALAVVVLASSAGGVYSLLAARRALVKKKRPRRR